MNPATFIKLLLLLIGIRCYAAERNSSSVTLLELELSGLTRKQYIETFWIDGAFYANFLSKSGDINVEVGTWKALDHQHKERKVFTNHPVKSPIPAIGLPKHVKSTKTHRLSESKGSQDYTVTIEETNVVEGFPFADRFYMVVMWEAKWPKSSSTTMQLTVSQHIVFKKGFWLESAVESNTIKETKETLRSWSRMASERVEGEGNGKAASNIKSIPPKGTSQDGSCVELKKGEGGGRGGLLRINRTSYIILFTGILTSLWLYKAQIGWFK